MAAVYACANLGATHIVGIEGRPDLVTVARQHFKTLGVPGAPFRSGTPTPPAVQSNSMTDGRLRWTVTTEVKAGVSRWVVKKTLETSRDAWISPRRKVPSTRAPYFFSTGRRPCLIIALK